jgi:hypothetical protein
MSYTEIDCTTEEVQKWYEAGLIPQELLDPNRRREFNEYILKNKEVLHKHFRRNPDEDHYLIKIPPQEEWDQSYELQVIDKRTGEIVKVLEKRADFELCEGIRLDIKAKELDDWKRETADVKNLTKEQHDHLKQFISTYGDRSLTRQEIVTFIEEIRKPKKPKKYRQSGHLVDQKLKFQQTKNQATLFDVLMPETKQKIEEARFEVKAEGIRLSYAENKLVHALNQLLCEKSQHANPEAEDFYSGNAPPQLVPYGVPNQKAPAPVLKFKPAELYKAFTGSTSYSGADVKFIIETLHQLESKKVLIKYDRVKKIKDGKKTKELTDRIEDFQSLIKIVSFIPDLTLEEKLRLDRGDGTAIRESKGEIIIALNPIFRDQIDTKYIEFPEDAQRRLVIAAGGHKKVTASMQMLMEYMLREMSANRYNPQINEDKLPYVLGLENYIKQKRNKRLKERIDKDIEAITIMGIITTTEKLPNSSGGFKWVFHLNKDYE